MNSPSGATKRQGKFANAEQALAGHVAGLSHNQVSQAASERACLGLIDTLACMMAGLRSPECEALARLLQRRGGVRESTAIGLPFGLPMPSAALVNGALAHWCEWDDLHDGGIIHASAAIWPVLIAVAEARNMTGPEAMPEIVATAIASYDVAGRISEVLTPLSPNGWYSTSVASAAAAAAGAARLCGLTEERILSAMGLAATASSLLRQAILDRVSGKNALCAQTASIVTAALDLAMSGVQGASTFLEGQFGLARMVAHGEVDFSTALADLGERFSVNEISLKPYPCCRATHPSIDLALELRTDTDVRAIARIDISVCEPMFEVVGRPFAPGSNPRMSALFSIPYTVSSALLHGRVNLATFEVDRIASDLAVRRLTERVFVTSYPVRAGVTMYQVPVTMTCTLADGTVSERSTVEVSGSPQKPLSQAEFERKLGACCTGALQPNLIQEFCERARAVRRQGLAGLMAISQKANYWRANDTQITAAE